MVEVPLITPRRRRVDQQRTKLLGSNVAQRRSMQCFDLHRVNAVVAVFDVLDQRVPAEYPVQVIYRHL
ncbi:MAG TPA: hypothetical protein VFX61_23640 [Micromonosporaceae bacterium]|nr:hypothetical protein [Micromonosporaceae bacterium]